MRRADVEARERAVTIAAAGSMDPVWASRVASKSPDLIYKLLVCDAGLFGKAYFGWKKTAAERRRLDRLWKRAQRIAAA